MIFFKTSATPVTASPPPPQPGDPPRSASLLRVMGAVLWSFLGIRRKVSGERDALTIKPLHVVVAGVLAVAIFVVLLVLLVSVVTRGH